MTLSLVPGTLPPSPFAFYITVSPSPNMPGVVTEPNFKRITVKEIHPTFAAEVQGVDFGNTDDETMAEIRAAMAKVRLSP